jgi:hypothetical protein
MQFFCVSVGIKVFGDHAGRQGLIGNVGEGLDADFFSAGEF